MRSKTQIHRKSNGKRNKCASDCQEIEDCKGYTISLLGIHRIKDTNKIKKWKVGTRYLLTVRFLKTDPKARYQGYTFYFREGLCWSDINTMFLKCRKKEKSIHDVKSMSIFGVSNLLSEDYIITMINSTLISHYVDNFVNNTQTFQINDARQLPIIIPTSTDDEQAKSFVSNAIKIKKGHTTNNALDVIQKEVDSYVEKIYNL